MSREPDLAAITLLTSVDGQPVNKLVTRRPDGAVVKTMGVNSGHFHARTIQTPDLAALADAVREIVDRPDALLSLSIFPGYPEFEILPMGQLAAAIGCDPHDRATLAGWHDLGGKIPVCARMRENVVLSANLLLDRDLPEGIPSELAELDDDGFDAALSSLFPGLASCAMVRVPSTSGRLIVDSKPDTSHSGHRIVQVRDPDLIEAKWKQATLRSLITAYEPTPGADPIPLAFSKPVRDRKNSTNTILRHDWWPLVDRCTWAPARLVFEGRPAIKGRGIKLADSAVRTTPGGLLDLARVPDLTQAELEEICETVRRIKGIKPTIRLRRSGTKGRRSPVVEVVQTVRDVTSGMDIETEDGWTTFGAWSASDAGHTRCQSPFRDGTSWAAFLGRHADGEPFLFDSGTGEKHMLRLDQRPTVGEMVEDLLIGNYEPSRTNAKGNEVYSDARQAWLAPADVRLTIADVDALKDACDAPRDKNTDLVKIDALASMARRWIPHAFASITSALPVDMSGEIGDQVGAMLRHMIHIDGSDGSGWLKRPVGVWVHYLAKDKPGHWVRLGVEAMGRIDTRGFQIAIRHALARQLSVTTHAEIAKMTPTAFAKACERAGIVDPDRATNVFAGNRWLFLSIEYIEGLDLNLDHAAPTAATSTAAAARLVSVVSKSRPL